MAGRGLKHVIADCQRALREGRAFASDAHIWSLPGATPHISRKKRDWMIEVAFLRGVLAFESFLEESFVLYSLGHKPPKGRAPHRYAFPPTRAHVDTWLREGRDHASWDVTAVSGRAQRFFRGGRPYFSPLQSNQSTLQDVRTIRNAIAHDSASAQQKFQNLVRRHLGTLPTNATPGSFLGMTVPASAPPLSFLDFYFDKVELVVTQIVRP